MTQIKTRIKNKHATESIWNNSPDFVPLQGELIIYDADDFYSYSRIKVGDGKTTVVNLPFLTDDVLPKPDVANVYQVIAVKAVDDNNKVTETTVYSVATDENCMELLAELGVINPVTDNTGAILVNNNNEIYVL